MKLLSANGVKTIVADLVARFEETRGQPVTVGLGEAGELRHRILAGEPFDIAFLPAATLVELAEQRKIAPATIVEIARTEVGMAAPAGAALPEVGTADGLRQALLAAASIVITDPASGGVSGVHFSDVLARLGIAEAVAPKLKLTRGVFNAELVARGEADLAIQLAHEIRLVDGVEFVALPAEFRRTITFSAATATAASDGAAAELLRFLSGPAAAPVISARGMTPVSPRATC